MSHSHTLQAWDLAHPVCLLAIFLGSLTSRGLAITPPKPVSTLRRGASTTVNIVAIAVLLFYAAILLHSPVMMYGLVDIAIDGLMLEGSQPASHSTPFFNAQLARPHSLFRQALRVQLWTWPWLLVAMVYMSATLKRTLSRRALLCSLLLTLLLCLPSLGNFWWLGQGVARTLTPQTFLAISEQPQPHWLSLFLLFQMLSIYFVSRGVPVREQNDGQLPAKELSPTFIDQYFVGLLLVGLGTARSIEISRVQYFWFQDFMVGLAELLHYPEFVVHASLAFFGIYWIWKRWRSRKLPSMERWPQFNTAQLTYAPLAFCLLLGIVALGIPFGIAILHAGL